MKKKLEKIGKLLNKNEQKKIAGKGNSWCTGIPCINPWTGQPQCNPNFCSCGSFGTCVGVS